MNSRGFGQISLLLHSQNSAYSQIVSHGAHSWNALPMGSGGNHVRRDRRCNHEKDRQRYCLEGDGRHQQRRSCQQADYSQGRDLSGCMNTAVNIGQTNHADNPHHAEESPGAQRNNCEYFTE